jgi:PAS domain S-box-containing protein
MKPMESVARGAARINSLVWVLASLALATGLVAWLIVVFSLSMIRDKQQETDSFSHEFQVGMESIRTCIGSREFTIGQMLVGRGLGHGAWGECPEDPSALAQRLASLHDNPVFEIHLRNLEAHLIEFASVEEKVTHWDRRYETNRSQLELKTQKVRQTLQDLEDRARGLAGIRLISREQRPASATPALEGIAADEEAGFVGSATLSVELTEVITEIMELQALVGDLRMETDPAKLRELMRVRFPPTLTRAMRSLNEISREGSLPQPFEPHLLEILSQELFGQASPPAEWSEDREPAAGSLFHLKMTNLELEDEKERLIDGSLRLFSQADFELDRLGESHVEIFHDLSAQSRDRFRATAFNLLLLGLLSSLFFFWIAWQVSQAVRSHVTSIQNASLEIKASEKRFRTLFRGINDALLIIDRERILDCNDEALAMFGFPDRESIIGLEPLRLFDPHLEKPADPVRWAARNLVSARSAPKHRFETGCLKRDGTRFPVEVTLSVLELEGREVYQALIRDVSERIRTEQELRESEEMFRSIGTSAKDAIVMMDNQGNVTYWNKAAERMFGFTVEEATGKYLHEFLASEEYRPSFYQAFPHFQETGEGAAVGSTLELVGLHKSGKRVVVELSLSALQLRGKWHALGIMRDVTLRKEAERAIQEARDAAEQSARAKSQFLANISHEIRTPLNGVIGMLGLLERTELNPEQREFTETAVTSADALLHLINDILDFSKIEAGKMELDSLDFNLTALVEGVNDSLAFQAQQKGLEYLCLIDPDIPRFLRGDPGRVRQVLVNLIGNAIKFTPRGQIEIQVTREEFSDRETEVRFQVRDTGIGIPSERIAHLFEAFTQADSSTTRKYGGTGLGLNISKKLVQLMGGGIEATSKVGEGSCFSFNVFFSHTERTFSEADLSDKALEGKRFLVLDDHPTNRRILHTQIRSWGGQVEESEDGETALEILREAMKEGLPYDLVLVDMQMPGMDGEEFAARVRSDPLLKQTRLILLTSLGTSLGSAQLGHLGFFANVTKPIKRNSLFDCLLGALGSNRTVSTKNSPPAQTPRPAGSFSARILLAEDNRVNQMVAAKMLENIGHTVTVVGNGVEAIEALREGGFHLVLMDVQMPEMDGLEATRRIRNSDPSELDTGIPIIAMTAHAMKGDREICLAAGMDGYLSKPLSRGDLEKTVAETLESLLPPAS